MIDVALTCLPRKEFGRLNLRHTEHHMNGHMRTVPVLGRNPTHPKPFEKCVAASRMLPLPLIRNFDSYGDHCAANHFHC